MARAKAQIQQDTDLIKRLFEITPMIDLSYQFALDLRELSKGAYTKPKSGIALTKFDQFQKRANSPRSGLAREWRALVGPANESIDDLLTSADFLRQLPTRSFRTSQLDAHLTRFEAFFLSALQSSEPSVDSARRLALPAVLAPFLRAAPKFPPDWPENCARRLESLMENAQEAVRRRIADLPELLELKNTLLFAYVVVCNAVGVGLSPAVFSYHLFLYRTISATAWASLSAGLRLQYAAVCLYMAQRFFPIERPFAAQLGISFKALADLRMVLEDASGVASNGPTFSHQYVFKWWLDKLESEVFLLHNEGLGRALPVLTRGEQGSIVELASRFSSYRYPVTADHLEAFLLQFGSTRRIRGALRLLSAVRLYPLWQLAEAVEELLRKEVERYGEIVIAPLGDFTGSSSILNYMAAHSPLKNLLFVEDLRRALEKTENGGRVYFIDDCVLSATQTLSVVGDLMGTRKLKPHHTAYCTPLPARAKTAISNRTVVFVYCVATDGGLERLRTNLPGVGLQQNGFDILHSIIEPMSVKAFGALSPVAWASTDERDEMKQFCAEVGYELLAERALEKSWTDQRRRESSLGFSDNQKLLVFPYSVPKSTLTLLWSNGNNSRNWLPLFPTLD